MKTIFCIVIFSSIIELAGAQTLSAKERKFVIDLLKSNTQKFLASIEGVNEEQWKFKPNVNTWSVAEVAEHITASEGFLLSITQNVLKSPADPDRAKALEGNEQQILAKAADRSVKGHAPDMIKPYGQFSAKKDLIDAFKAAREKTITYIKTTADPLKHHLAAHPAVGDLTAYQLLVWIAAHANRHVAQLEEVKSNPDFPK
jgi:uncharacterized damage-inducible protein DinB